MNMDDDLKPEYTADMLGKGVRGKHYADYMAGHNMIKLTPELARIFPTEKSVHEALTSLVNAAQNIALPRPLQ
jgi:hypothetical protein